MKFLAILILALAAVVASQRCDRIICSNNYNPVCGSDGITYQNRCAFRQAACRSSRFLYIVANRECRAPRVCDDVTCPVGEFCIPEPKQCITAPCPQYTCVDEAVATCNKIGCPFNNVCVFKPKECFTTPCPQHECIPRPTCPEFCTKIYAPVCGNDGRTYGNLCMLQAAVCENLPRLLEVEYEGECDPCTTVCPTDYNPVCGSNGVTYDNICFFTQAACLVRPLSLVGEGECPEPTEPSDCPDFCPALYNPVCGSDGKTYSNACELSLAACRIQPAILTQVSQGECPTPEPVDPCTGPCTLEYAPVCGSNGVTYGNMCFFTQAACLIRGLTIVSEGECPTAAPNDFCDGVTCPEGERCIPEPKYCITTPCYQYACVPLSDCPDMCPMLYAPVCGSDGKTYSNGCFLSQAACRLRPEILTQVHEGECEEPANA